MPDSQIPEHGNDGSIHDYRDRGPLSRHDSELFRRMSAVEQWQAEHRGVCTERQVARAEWQRRTDADISVLQQDMVNLKVKLALIAGGAAAGGGIIGTVVTNLLGAS